MTSRAPSDDEARASITLRSAVFALAALLTATPLTAAPRAVPAECRAAPARTDSLTGLGPRGELVLASGGRAVLGSLRWPDDPEAARAAEALVLAHRDRSLTLVARGAADRWGRSRVDALSEDGTTDLAGALIGAGLAHADAGEGDALCRPALLQVENAARERGLGLWRRPVVEAGDGPALRAAEGRFAVVRGRVRHVGERASRTYLDFAPRGEEGLTVTVSKRNWRRMAEHGLSAAALQGRLVRVRGLVEARRGPTIDVAAPEAVEVLDEAPASPGDEREQVSRR